MLTIIPPIHMPYRPATPAYHIYPVRLSLHVPYRSTIPTPHHFLGHSIRAPYPPATLALCDPAAVSLPRPIRLLRVDFVRSLLFSKFGFFVCCAKKVWRKES